MSKRRLSKNEVLMQFATERAKTRTDDNVLHISKATKNNQNFVVGCRVSISIVLLELYQYYQMDKEWLHEFYYKYIEFLNAYTDDDQEEFVKMLDDLNKEIGFHTLSGAMDSEEKEENTNE